MARSDDYGLWWQDEHSVKNGRTVMNRPIPPIPDTGWRPPEYFPDLSGAKMIAIDTETKDVDLRSKGPGFRRGAHVVGVSVGTDDGFRGYFPVRHEIGGGNMEPEHVFTWLHDQLCDTKIPIVGANLLYDLDALANEGVHTGNGPKYDVQSAEPLLDEYRRSYALDLLGAEYLGEGKSSEALYRWCSAAYGGNPDEKQRGNIYRAPVSLVGPYAEGDVDLPLRIFEKQKARLEKEDLWSIFDLETRLVPLLLAMRRRGVLTDSDRAHKLEADLTEKIYNISKKLGGISINAAADIARLCDKEGIRYPRTAPSANYPEGQPSFQKEWLKAHNHPLMRELSQARTFTKFRDTFIRSYIYENSVEGRIHCQFNQLRGDDSGTVSGRFSSSNPNLQNIPKRKDGKFMRSAYVPDPGEDWVRFDWSQIEFRLLVHTAALAKIRGAEDAVRMYCDDPTTDFHEMVNGLCQVGRDEAKTINFGLVYGMGAPLLAKNLNRPIDEAMAIMEIYNGKVPFVKGTYDLASRTAKNRGHIRTLLKRRARFPGGEFTHKALNRALQGGAGDIMKLAMVEIWESGICDVVGAPLLTVHDELDWSVPRTREAREAVIESKRIMETCVELKIPLIAEMEVGEDWAACKPMSVEKFLAEVA